MPQQLEQFELAEHARALLGIPRVLALEPGRFATPKFLRDTAPLRQAKRLKLPGRPRVVIFYHPLQYPLARALRGRYEEAELWYFRPAHADLRTEAGGERTDLADLDSLAYDRASRTVLTIEFDSGTEELYARLREFEVISSRPFVPGARLAWR